MAGGVMVGIAAAYWTTKLLGKVLSGVAPLDLLTFVAMSGSKVS